MYENVMKEVKFRNPIVHCITNYVTVNDCANAILATGGLMKLWKLQLLVIH